ncbi:transmembrane protein 60-like [Hyalella azteca]|uniref:Transmembrane protein 60-like n=1 Tax=Hyalella azteca TaxID=294128 RepID=A0A8B7PCP1_HYAAZ|nr:transmembrane protein 60-like [Hyalella azteca]
MAMIHRSLLAWFLVLVFLIFVGLRIDGRTHWNFFLVFVPMWLYDLFLVAFIVLKSIGDCRYADLGSYSIKRIVSMIIFRLYLLTMTLLKTAFCVMLCVNLNSPASPPISWYGVFTPLIILLVALSFNVIHELVNFSFGLNSD